MKAVEVTQLHLKEAPLQYWGFHQHYKERNKAMSVATLCVLGIVPMHQEQFVFNVQVGTDI